MRTASSEVSKCFFCDSTGSDLYEVLIFQLERRVKQCATIVEDNTLFGKFSAGDITAKDAMSCSKCLLALYRRSKQKSCVLDGSENVHGQVLAELALYMEQTANDDKGYRLKPATLANLYKIRVRELGNHTLDRVHTTKLKQRLMLHIENLKEF